MTASFIHLGTLETDQRRAQLHSLVSLSLLLLAHFYSRASGSRRATAYTQCVSEVERDNCILNRHSLVALFSFGFFFL